MKTVKFKQRWLFSLALCIVPMMVTLGCGENSPTSDNSSTQSEGGNADSTGGGGGTSAGQANEDKKDEKKQEIKLTEEQKKEICEADCKNIPQKYAHILDCDADGLTFAQEEELGTDPCNFDTDGDGLSDGDEVNTHGTDPKNDDSDGDGLKDGDEIKGTEANGNHKTNPLSKDSDKDGLSDWDEIKTYNTDPNNPDTDGDGFSDGDEVKKYGTSPTDAKSVPPPDIDPIEICRVKCDDMNPRYAHLIDCDYDGLTNAQEQEKGTDPCKADTDGDGLNDGAEVNIYGTDPTNPDTDGDGLNDGDEVKYGFKPAQKSSLNDGILDGQRWVVDVCKKEEMKPQQVKVHTNAVGDWKVALTEQYDIPKGQPVLTTDDKFAAASVYDLPSFEVYSAIVSMTPKTGVNNATDAINQLNKDIRKIPGLNVDEDFILGNNKTHDGYTFNSLDYKIRVTSQSTQALRNTLLKNLGSYKPTDLTGLDAPKGKSHTIFTLKAAVIYREKPTSPNFPKRVIVTFSIAPADAVTSDEKVLFLVEDFVNTSTISRKRDELKDLCEVFRRIEATPTADFYFVVDQSGSMYDENKSVADLAEFFWSKLAQTDLDFRVGVTSSEYPMINPFTKGVFGMVIAPYWTTRRADFLGSFKQILDNLGGAYEFGLRAAKEGILAMSKSSAPARARIRPEADLITIWISDEEDNDFQHLKTTDPTYTPKLNAYKKFFTDHRVKGFCLTDRSTWATNDGKAYRDVCLNTGGASADLKSNMTKEQMRPFIEKMIDVAAGTASPFKLSNRAISPTLTVWKTMLNKKAGNPTEGQPQTPQASFVRRSRVHGYDFNAGSGAVSFFGNFKPDRAVPGDETKPGDDIAISYKYFRVLSKD